ncbi:Eco57I restriction-modification methylase domain-containing protein [Crocosphaera sp. XPORK-15E]|uniref:Eco57I restriction-modification methylase domain-containing protein n=1 Tax=Crocosphaera sp. XPORK-15E TaxID=3110247 RepID=UPI002B1FA3A7|nr:DNA methyltransferase [Crocosphaera sp. XPORK-15E]MEA5537070.1 DNA methyltransferase [Crocosphaera sp. XPORK-15E]
MNDAALDVEELGSVYESLLDFTPKIVTYEGIYAFKLVAGSDRKTTGSYYTPPELVGQLIKSALEPVIKEKLAQVRSGEQGVGSSASILLANPQKVSQNQDNSGSQNHYNLGRQNQDNLGSSASILLANPQKRSQNQDNLGSQNQDNLGSSASILLANPQKGRDNQDNSGRQNQDNLGRDNQDNSGKNQDNLGSETLPLLTLQQRQEAALLSITVCDPACGSGHFLLAAARRIGKELARIRTGEVHPSPEPLSQTVRDVIQHCIYGVDYNPLSVDLCKVALWIEGFCKGYPLNFLDHRIKCGNSLVGVLDISVLKEGIPEGAFKAVTGDEKQWATALKKRNQKEIESIENNQLSLFDNLGNELGKYAQDGQKLGNIPEVTTDDVKRKKEQYISSHSEENEGWWRDYSACNLWTAAFFMPLTEGNLQLLPTTATLHRLLEGNKTTEAVVKAANKLAEEKRFFHWCLEFPEVFDHGGFSCVLGNPH